MKRYLAPDVRKITTESDLSKWANNAFLKDICDEFRIPNFYCNRTPSDLPYRKEGNIVRRCIDHIHSSEEYVRYDYFRNHFCYYYLKAVAQSYLEKQNQIFGDAWEDHSQYVKLLQKVFPTATIHPYKDRLDQMREYVEGQLAGNLEKEFTKEEVLQHMTKLNSILFDTPKEHLKEPNALLKYISLKVVRVC